MPACSSSTTSSRSGLPETLPPEDVVTYKTDPINVTPGTCVVHVELLKGNVQEDFVPHAGSFDVHDDDDDSFGRGMLPTREYVRCMGQRWTLDAARVPGAGAQP